MNSPQISVRLCHSEHNSWLDIDIPDAQISSHSTMTLMNALGEQIQQFFVIGQKHQIDITGLKSQTLNLKIETVNATFMKKIR
jgi:hypothetical protein